MELCGKFSMDMAKGHSGSASRPADAAALRPGPGGRAAGGGSRRCARSLGQMSDTPSDSGGTTARDAVRRDALHTRFCDLVGCELPVVQTGMGWVSGARLTAATSAAGGFGILAAVTMTPEQLRQQVAEVKERTDRPFGVNFRADQPDLAELLAFVVSAGVRLVSFAGAPTKDAVARCHDAGVLVMPTCGARRHAEKVAEWGVDAVIAQGAEGGGHTGSVPTSLLLPQVHQFVPIIAAVSAGALIAREEIYADLREMLRDLKKNPWKFFWKE